MNDEIVNQEVTEPGAAEPGQFVLKPLRDADGNQWSASTNSGFEKIWNWGYWINGGPPDPRQYDLAIKISDAADTIREFGRPPSMKKAKEKIASQEIMVDLVHLFSAVLVQEQQADLDRSSKQVDKHQSDFFRRVVTPRHRRNLRGPVILTILAMLVALIIAYFSPVKGSPTPPDWPVLLRALGLVVAGTLMGRLLFFAMSHSEKIEDIEEYFKYESVSGEAAILSLVFDVIVGGAAFVVFQTGLIIISIGADTDASFQGISTLQIDENGLVAFGFGILVGLSRTAFLNRVREMARNRFGRAAKS